MRKFLVILMVVAMASFLFVGCLPTTNHAPVIITTALPDATVGTAYTATVKAIDADDDALTFSVSGPTGMVINTAGAISGWTPIATGIEIIVVAVTDGKDSVSANFAIKVSAVAPDPELQLIGIVVDPKKMDLYVEEEGNITSVTATYEIRGYDADIDLEDCLFLTSNIKVATVEKDKDDPNIVTVTAVGKGIANILVEYESKFATLKVTVTKPKSMKIIADLPAFTEGVEGVPSVEEFTIEVVANDDAGKNVEFHFTLPGGIIEIGSAITNGYTLELKNKVTGSWEDLGEGATDAAFGAPLSVVIPRDPLADEVLSFRATFGLEAEGIYKIMVIVMAEGEAEPLCTKVITATVITKPPVF
ncbi:hypothetical protein ES705_44462 [subsurface metagenome]